MISDSWAQSNSVEEILNNTCSFYSFTCQSSGERLHVCEFLPVNYFSIVKIIEHRPTAEKRERIEAKTKNLKKFVAVEFAATATVNTPSAKTVAYLLCANAKQKSTSMSMSVKMVRENKLKLNELLMC